MTKGYIGKIIRIYVECGNCGEATDLDAKTKHDADKEANRLGWQATTINGWVCPDCRSGRDIAF